MFTFKGVKMKVTNSQKKENPLLKRTQYTLKVEAEKMPKREEAREFFASELKADKDLLVLRKLDGKFAERTVTAEVYVYSDKDAMMKIEENYVLKRNGFIQDETEE